jgi:hypothetical protein
MAGLEGGATWQEVGIMATPYAGYYKFFQNSDLTIKYEAYESVSD